MRTNTARAALALVVLAALGAPPFAAPAQGARSAAAQIVGTFRLARYAPHGNEPTGRIEYDAAGRMWAMIFSPGRKPVDQNSTPEQWRDTARGVVAYYGTYTIDEATGRVIHHVEAASNPAWVGTDFIRWYRFEGANLVISLNPRFENSLLWERLPGPPSAVGSAGERSK